MIDDNVKRDKKVELQTGSAMGLRSMRMILLITFLVLFTLFRFFRFLAPRPESTFVLDPLTIKASFNESDLPCGSPDPFTKSEDARVVDLYFADRAQSANHFNTTSAFLLQPRLAACQGSHDADWEGAAVALDMLVLVASPSDQAHVRKAIRSSWGSVVSEDWPFSQMPWKVNLIFLVGRHEASVNGISGGRSTELIVLTNEQKLHGDLLHGDFEDWNLTLKILRGLLWVSAHCDTDRIRYVLKVDQDTFVHLDHLLTLMQHLQKTHPRAVMERFVLGHVECFSKVHRYDTWSTIKVNPAEFPFSVYPPHVRGSSYLMAGRLVPKLVDASRCFPVLPREDAFITGVLVRALRLNHVHLQGVSSELPCRLTPCLFLSTRQLTATNVDVALMAELWQAVQAGPSFCHRSSSLWTQACQLLTRWTQAP